MNAFPKGRKKISVSRDDNYNLSAILDFDDPDFIYKPSNSSNLPGSFVESFNITGSDFDNRVSTLEYSYINTAGTKSDNGGEFSGSANLGFHSLIMKTDNTNKGVHLTEWYLNRLLGMYFHE